MSYQDDIRGLMHEELVQAIIVINNEMHQEAAERNFCDAFDDFIERVNQQAGAVVLQPRQNTKRIRVIAEFDVHRDYTEPDFNDARAWIREQAGEYEDSITGFLFEAEEMMP